MPPIQCTNYNSNDANVKFENELCHKLKIKQCIQQQHAKVTATKANEHFDNEDIPFTKAPFENKCRKMRTQTRNNVNASPTEVKQKKNYSLIPNG